MAQTLCAWSLSGVIAAPGLGRCPPRGHQSVDTSSGHQRRQVKVEFAADHLFHRSSAEDATCLPDPATLDQRRECNRVFHRFIICRLALPFKTLQAGEFFKTERFQWQRGPEQDTGRSKCDQSEDARSFYEYGSELRGCILTRLAHRR